MSDQEDMRNQPTLSLARATLPALAAAVVFTLILDLPAYALGDLGGVIDSIRNWVAGLLAALATLFLTIGGVSYLTAGGNQRTAEEGKEARPDWPIDVRSSVGAADGSGVPAGSGDRGSPGRGAVGQRPARRGETRAARRASARRQE